MDQTLKGVDHALGLTMSQTSIGVDEKIQRGTDNGPGFTMN
jgi:hypothetical protein